MGLGPSRFPVPADAPAGEARPQSPFLWTEQPRIEQMHDLPEVLSLLEGLPEKVSRESGTGIPAAI